jgi:hypothetical protein
LPLREPPWVGWIATSAVHETGQWIANYITLVLIGLTTWAIVKAISLDAFVRALAAPRGRPPLCQCARALQRCARGGLAATSAVGLLEVAGRALILCVLLAALPGRHTFGKVRLGLGLA